MSKNWICYSMNEKTALNFNKTGYSFTDRLLASGCLTVVLIVYSEYLFWARYKPGMLEESWLTFTFYFIATYIMLSFASFTGTDNIWKTFMLGAIYGWFIEGIVVQTCYENLPLSISFTGLSWHALISVLFGWYIMGRTIASRNRKRLTTLSSLFGIVYGLWAVWWWTETNNVTSSVSFGVYTLVLNLILMTGYFGSSRFGKFLSKPSKLEKIFLISISMAYFIVVTIPSSPISALLAPILFGFTFFALWRSRTNLASEAIPSPFSINKQQNTEVKVEDCLPIMLMSLTSIATYTSIWMIGIKLWTGPVLYIITVPLGFILYVISWVKLSIRGLAKSIKNNVELRNNNERKSLKF